MNFPTILVGLIVAVIFVAIIVSEIRKRKSGKGSCSCGCDGCSMSNICHKKEE